MTKPGVTDGQKDALHAGYAHIALSLGEPWLVDGKTEELRNAGYEVLDGPRMTGDGYYEAVIADPDGNRVELTE